MDCAKLSLNSKERRNEMNKAIKQISQEMPFINEKSSQLRIMKGVCTFFKKESHFRLLEKSYEISHSDEFFLNHYCQVLNFFMLYLPLMMQIVYIFHLIEFKWIYSCIFNRRKNNLLY